MVLKDLIRIIIVICLSGSVIALPAQNTVSSSGGNANGPAGSMSYTVGQIVNLTITGTAGTISQGIQQPYEITVITGNEELGISLEWSVYPNPASEFIMLKVDNYDFEKLYYQLFNLSGDLLQKRNADSNQTQIHVGNLKSGTYFLKVTDNIRVFTQVQQQRLTGLVQVSQTLPL